MLLACIHVDDILCLSSSIELVIEFKSEMQKNFDTTYQGMLCYFLGMEVLEDKHRVFVSQRKYAQEY